MKNQLSVISYQLPVTSYQLPVINYQLSVISYQLSAMIELTMDWDQENQDFPVFTDN